MTSTTLTKMHVTPHQQQVALPPTKHTTQPQHKKAGPKTTVKEPSSHSKPGQKPKNKKQQRMVNSDGETTDGQNSNKQKANKKQAKSPSMINPTQALPINKQAQYQQQQHSNHHQQQRRNVLPVKVRRMERRKDIESMTEALQTSQADLLSSSPPVSATESEDSDPGRMEQQKRSQGNNKIKKKPNVDNAATFPPLNQSKKSRRQEHHQGNKIVYAGPTFNNAPAPSALPIPALSNGSQSTQHDEVFYMEVIPPRPVQQPDFQQQSRDLMNLLAPRRTAPVIHHPHPYQLAAGPMMPMMPMMPMINHTQRDHTLSQIQSDLRSMLKLEAAS